MNIFCGVIFFVFLCGCSADQEQREHAIGSISQVVSNQRSCVANGFTSEPACFYSVFELAEMKVSSPVAIYSDGRIAKVDKDFYLISMNNPEMRVRIWSDQDVEVLDQAIIDPRRNHVVVFGNYEKIESVQSIHALSIRWINP